MENVLECGSVYKFSNGINYFQELFTSTLIFLNRAQGAHRKKESNNDDIREEYEFVVEYLGIILDSQNKSANKLLNQTGANNAPSG